MPQSAKTLENVMKNGELTLKFQFVNDAEQIRDQEQINALGTMRFLLARLVGLKSFNQEKQVIQMWGRS